MKTQILITYKSIIRVVSLLVTVGVFGNASPALARGECRLAPGVTPPAGPPVTAQQVEHGSASNMDFALAVRDQFRNLIQGELSLGQSLHFECLIRQEGGPYRSGSTYTVLLTPDGRVFVHAKDMALAGRQLHPAIYGQILLALGVPQTDLAKLASHDPLAVARAGAALIGTLSREPDAPFDATIPGIPTASGHAAVYTSGDSGLPLVLLGGFDLTASHLLPPAQVDYVPAITAKDVVDRKTLKSFVTEAGKFFLTLQKSGDIGAFQKAKVALRDPNGPWRHGSVYLYILDRTSKTILLHTAFPDRFELRPLTATVRDAVTGELLLPRVIEAATSNAEGGFVQYHFDDPTDDTDSADIPKVGYARQFADALPSRDGTLLQADYVVGSGLYLRPSDGGPTMTGGCSDHSIVASEVRTQSDIRAFVTCAAEYLAEHGTREARRAFHEDQRWRHGQTYLGVLPIRESGTDTISFVFPPDPSRETRPWGALRDDFGDDLFTEFYRIVQVVDAGWAYYAFADPTTGRPKPKATYLIKVNWDGEPATIGAGIYSRDWPGACNSDEASAAALGADPSPETLREFVRCAVVEVEADGYFAMEKLEEDPRWIDGAHYVYVLDMMGNQVMSGNQVRVNGQTMHEWGRGGNQFGGRDMVDVGGTFGETFVYYRSYNPLTGAHQGKAGFLKRVVAQGVPLLVGSGYYLGAEPAASGPSCADRYVTAAAVRTQAEVRAFVRCAAEYALEHGEEEARRAFNEDVRWKSGPTYLFVDGIQPSGADSQTHVFPPDPSREGAVWGTSIDGFGNDYYFELHRMLSLVDEGWIYYAFNNPETGRSQLKSSYVIEIDWNGERAAIGAGVYARDFPGACDPTEVNAADLAANPGDQRLQEFVRCAAMEVESSGYFAGPVLSSDPRWKHGPIYVFGINAETGTVEFSGNPASFATSGRIPELLFDGRDAISVGELFGESYWYYNFNNPATGDAEAKVSYVKLVRAQGVPLLVGAG